MLKKFEFYPEKYKIGESNEFIDERGGQAVRNMAQRAKHRYGYKFKVNRLDLTTFRVTRCE